MTDTKSRSIFLCIFRNFLCISKNGWPHHKFAPKLLNFFLVAFDLYTQPWTKLQNEIQHFVFFRTGYPPPPLRAFFLVSNLYFVLFKNPIILYLSIFCTISAAEEYLVFLRGRIDTQFATNFEVGTNSL